jgi:hypothetical protein
MRLYIIMGLDCDVIYQTASENSIQSVPLSGVWGVANRLHLSHWFQHKYSIPYLVAGWWVYNTKTLRKLLRNSTKYMSQHCKPHNLEIAITNVPLPENETREVVTEACVLLASPPPSALNSRLCKQFCYYVILSLLTHEPFVIRNNIKFHWYTAN